MGLLLQYARTMLIRPHISSDSETGIQLTGKGRDEQRAEKEEIDMDLKLLLDSVEPVFQSRNPAVRIFSSIYLISENDWIIQVVLAATKVFFYGAPTLYWYKFVGPVVRLLANSKEVERVVLIDLLIIAKDAPHLFAAHYTRFLVRSDDLTTVKKAKIQLLLSVLTVDNWNPILREFIVSAFQCHTGIMRAPAFIHTTSGICR